MHSVTTISPSMLAESSCARCSTCGLTVRTRPRSLSLSLGGAAGARSVKEELRDGSARGVSTLGQIHSYRSLLRPAEPAEQDGVEQVAAREVAATRGPSRREVLAGLACGDELRRQGVLATIHEASERAGGRCFSLGGAFPGPIDFPGQVAERGGEFIDTAHKTMIGYARRFRLPLEDVAKRHADVLYHFFGRDVPEAEVVDGLRGFVDAMRDGLRAVGRPTADSFTPADAALDRTSLGEYLDTRGAGPLIKAVIDVAYTIEYGLEINRQSCLLFIHADRRSKFTPFGTSDERYHVIGGNQQIPAALATGLGGQIRYGASLQRARKTAAGRLELTLQMGSSTVTGTHDAVVFAIPFSVLRDVELDPSLGLPGWKLFAIQNLAYGTNAKMMLGFRGPMWLALGSNSQSFSDLENHQNTWETNPALASSDHAVRTHYSGGDRGARRDSTDVPTEAARFLADLDKVYPGASVAVTRDAAGTCSPTWSTGHRIR